MSDELTALTDDFIRRSAPFLSYLVEWEKSWPSLTLEDYLRDGGRQAWEAAVLCVDIINGFCHQGPLASERVKGIIAPIVALFQAAHRLGIPHFLLIQDTHQPDAEEFASFAPHCIAGSPESQTVPELATLPFAHLFTVIPKNSLHPALGTTLDGWLESHPQVKELVAVGDVTDLCLYQLAMHLKLRSNALGLGYRVTVPADCVQTYDLPVEVAAKLNLMPHDGDLLHRLFLYHLALNGVRIVRRLA